MAKGKKKGKSTPAASSSAEEATAASSSVAEATAAVSGLTLEQTQPSTSAAPTEGLTGGKKPTPEVKATPSQPEPEPEDVGLTGPSKSRRRRPKKPSLAVQEAQAQAASDAQASTAPTVSAPPPQQRPPVVTPTVAPAPTPWGSAPVPTPASAGPSTQRQPPAPQSWRQQPGSAGTAQRQPPQQWQGPPPTAMPPPGTAQRQPPQQWQGPPPTAMPPPGTAQRQPPQPWQSPAPTAMPPPGTAQRQPPQQWQGPPPTAMPPPGQPGQSHVQPTPMHQQQGAGDRASQPLPKSRQEIVCKYTIPAKILGNTVQAQRINVITNYLPMTFKPVIVHRYDFLFIPDKPKKVIPHVYTIFKDKFFAQETIAFDGFKNGYCLKQLDKKIVEDPTTKEGRRDHKIDYTDINGRVMNFTVSLKYTGFVDFNKIMRHMEHAGSSLAPPQEEIQCMDVILRQGTLSAYVKSGRNFFKRPERPINLGGGLEMWTGLFQSAIFTNRPYINIDVAHKGFPIQQSMVKVYETFNLDFNRTLEQQGFNGEKFKDFVKNLRVVCTLKGGANEGQKREYIVNCVKESPKLLYFQKEDGGKMSVYDYFVNEKRYKIQYPLLPCLWVGVRNKSIYYPLELIAVSYGQVLRRQLNEFQLATMVREAATPPEERKRKIEEVARSMNYSQNPYFKKFGLEISNQFLTVEAKVLQPPVLNCGEQRVTLPSRGQWNSQKLFKAEALTSWGFIGIEMQPHACNFDYTKDLIMQTGRQMGMQVAEPKAVAFNVLMRDVRAFLLKASNDQQIRLVFVVVPNRGRDYYHKVKQLAEIDVGILTQCIKEQTIQRRMNPQTIKNILLKVNSKLMGTNQALDAKSTPHCIASGGPAGVMIVGADVTHPSPEQQNIPSIAAVTASMDPKCFIYNIELSIQSPKEEVIKEFADIMYDHLKVFVQRNGKPPKKIYVFRDGVSEGQFGQIMNSELAGLLQAYSKFSKEKPEVLFLLVQKRHHTRLFGTDRNRRIVNVEPGTVVDTHIVHQKELDFYLVSHAAIKGTARPTRYHGICNDGKIPHDEVEQLTFFLCHLYSRCMRSVSYPTPTYYAHLACLRARSLTHGKIFDNRELEGKPQRLRVMDKMLRSSRMFFV